MIQEAVTMRVRFVTKSVLSAALTTGAAGFLVVAPVGQALHQPRQCPR